ncbi:hypothetical protein HMI56_004979, partial [Coelomomyces lativittatus]
MIPESSSLPETQTHAHAHAHTRSLLPTVELFSKILSSNLFPPVPTTTTTSCFLNLNKLTVSSSSSSSSSTLQKEEDNQELWKLYTKAKDALPNGKRLENLTWRLMALSIHAKSEEEGEVLVEVEME